MLRDLKAIIDMLEAGRNVLASWHMERMTHALERDRGDAPLELRRGRHLNA